VTELATFLSQTGVVPVVVVETVDAGHRLAETLLAAGLPSVEVTLRTPAALDVVAAMASNPGLVVGAGTVLRPDQVRAAVEAGARYVVSPGWSAAVDDECAALGAGYIPGVATATEVQQRLEAGRTVLKLFPAAAAGGPALIRALSAPFVEARFVPTGGIDAESASDYLRLPSVLAVGGTWVAPAALVAEGGFAEIGRRAAAAVALVEELRCR
jgi:2-dehydro-3-deoxyphosphogluconate aldolase/(4S)-4-hydroxy-2-oxoglutarate aldolase